jgi:hypothetical protein
MEALIRQIKLKRIRICNTTRRINIPHTVQILAFLFTCADEIYPSGLMHLTANTEVSAFLGSILASFDTVEYDVRKNRVLNIVGTVLCKTSD